VTRARFDEKERELVLKLSEIIRQDPFRMRCLRALRALNVPQGYIGAGFVRNAIWDVLHNKATPTPLNDIDVIYFNSDELGQSKNIVKTRTASSFHQSPSQAVEQSVLLSATKEHELVLERELSRLVADANWQVKNQARMHLAHDHAPYKNCREAISYWVEQETCVAVRLTESGDLDVLAPFGLSANFAGTLSINPKHPRPDVLKQRVHAKNWLTQWPSLNVVDYPAK